MMDLLINLKMSCLQSIEFQMFLKVVYWNRYYYTMGKNEKQKGVAESASEANSSCFKSIIHLLKIKPKIEQRWLNQLIILCCDFFINELVAIKCLVLYFRWKCLYLQT